MGAIANYLDSIIVPLSLFFTIGYHAYLWHNLRTKPSLTSIGINMLKRRAWLRELNQAILTATVTVIVTLALAALTNNAFNASRLLSSSHVFGSQSARIMILKFGSASIFLVVSFLCSSMAVGYLVDANFLINSIGEFSPAGRYTEAVVERAFTLAVVGNRVLCMALPLLLWMFGPLPMAVSSLALVWALYELDFVTTFSPILV